MSEQELDNDIVSETENYVIWRSDDDQLGQHFHIALGGVTLHLTAEEWNELVVLIKGADS